MGLHRSRPLECVLQLAERQRPGGSAHPRKHRLLQRLPRLMETEDAVLRAEHITKSYDSRCILKGVSLHLNAGGAGVPAGRQRRGQDHAVPCPLRPGNAGGGTGASLRGGHHRPARQDQLHASAGPACCPTRRSSTTRPCPWSSPEKSKREARAEAAPLLCALRPQRHGGQVPPLSFPAACASGRPCCARSWVRRAWCCWTSPSPPWTP